MSEMIERVARAICGNSISGFCTYVGGHIGCKVGRGESYDGSNCAASREQLVLAQHWDQAKASIKFMREPTAAIVKAHHVVPDDTDFAERAADNWRNLIDALLDEGRTSDGD